MNNKKHFYRRLAMMSTIMIVAVLLLSACSLFTPAAATPDPLAQKETVDAAVAQALKTFSADLTSTAAALPTSTFTLAPTKTATPAATATLTSTPTKTRVPTTPKPTNTASPVAYGCKLISTSPADGTKINVNTDYDAKWVVKNIGTQSWEVGNLDLKYVSGTKMQTIEDVFDINTAVAAGAELTLIVDMKTPSTAGKYTASWILTMDGTTAFCALPLSIEAVNP